MSNSTIPDGGDYINPETARLEKYIGLSLALSSSFLIGTSFILTKRGLMEVARNNGGESNACEGIE